MDDGITLIVLKNRKGIFNRRNSAQLSKGGRKGEERFGTLKCDRHMLSPSAPFSTLGQQPLLFCSIVQKSFQRANKSQQRGVIF